MQTRACSFVATLFCVLLAACGGGGGGGGGGGQTTTTSKQTSFPMRYMHTQGIPYNDGPQAQGTTDAVGTFVYQAYPQLPSCDNSNTSSCPYYYDIDMSICGTPLPKVEGLAEFFPAFLPQNTANVTYQLPGGYNAAFGVYTWLPTDSSSAVDFASRMLVANNVTRVSMMASTSTNLADGLQLSPAVASGNCQPFSYSSTNLQADTASMQSIAPSPLPSVDAGNAYLSEMLVCRMAGAWQGYNDAYITTPNSTQETTISGDASLVFDVAGNMTGYMDFQKNAAGIYTGSVNFGGTVSLASDEIDFTIPAGSGPLSYTDISVQQVITNYYGASIDFQGPDGTKGGSTRMQKVGMYYFNPTKKYIATIQGASNEWVLEVDIDNAGNVGGYIADTPHYKTVVTLSGTMQGDAVTFSAFDWNQGRPNCNNSVTSGCKSSGTDTGPTVAPPSVSGSLTLNSITTTAVGTVTMPSDSVNATFTASAPLAGCYL